MNNIAVVICNYNKKAFVLECIESVFQSNYKNFDLIVVDNASTDGSVKAIRERYADRLTLLVNDENTGGSGGFNRGMLYAIKNKHYRYVHLLDDDVSVDKDAIGELYRFMEEHPEAGVCGSLVCKASSKEYIQEYGSNIDLEYISVTHLHAGKKVDTALPGHVICDYVAACSAMFRADILREIGVIDKDYFIYWDDLALCWEIRDHGHKVYACEKSIVWHHGSYGARTAFSRYYSFRNKIHVFAKYLSDEDYGWLSVNLTKVLFRIFAVNRDKPEYIMDYFHALDDALNNVRGKADAYKLSAIKPGNKKFENAINSECERDVQLCNHILDVEEYDRSKIYIDNYGNQIITNDDFEFFENYKIHEAFFYDVFYRYIRSKMDVLREEIRTYDLVKEINLEQWVRSSLPRPKTDAFGIHHHPYYIFTIDYRQQSAGNRVLYYLCHLLNECGYEAYTVDEKPVKGLRTPVLTPEIHKQHREDGRHPVAVYNEAIRGNPLEGDISVRWLMNREVYAGGEMIKHASDDLIFYWDRFYAKEKNSPDVLRLPIIDRNIFNMKGVDESKRAGFCYYAHKYLQYNNGQVQLPEEMIKNGISLCQDIKRSHTEIADILKKTKILYCYENSSIISEASLCGCSVIVVKTNYLSEFDINQFHNIPVIKEADIDYNREIYYNAVGIIEYDKTEMEAYNTLASFIAKTQDAAMNYTVSGKTKDELTEFYETHRNNIYIYGAGEIAKQCYFFLKTMDVEIKGFVVSENYAKIEQTYISKPIFRVSEMVEKSELYGIILAMVVSNQDEVIKILDGYGIKNYIRYSYLCPL